MDSLPRCGEECGESDKKGESFCAPKAAEAALCCPAPVPKATETNLCCSAPATRKDSSNGLDLAAMATDVADVDLNKWIGTLICRFFALSELL